MGHVAGGLCRDGDNCIADGIMPESLRQAMISLLYKKDDPELLKIWRPISLLNVDYKIITKVLVNRMKPLMSTVIDSDQCCAVPAKIMQPSFVTFVIISKFILRLRVRLYLLTKKKPSTMSIGSFSIGYLRL